MRAPRLRAGLAGAASPDTLGVMTELRSNYEIGSRVRVTQQAPHGTGVWKSNVEGELLRIGQQKTGSWFAHAKDNKLWLDRLEIRKDDGEIVVCNLDRYSVVERLGSAEKS